MELLPNSKCLTKIKNHLQLGLIRELIGLLPVGKQWGLKNDEFSLNAHTMILAIPFTKSNYLALPSGSYNGASEYTGKSQYVTAQTVSQFTLAGGGFTRWVAFGF